MLDRLNSSHGSGRVFLLPQCGTWLVYIRIVPHIRVIVAVVAVVALIADAALVAGVAIAGCFARLCYEIG